MWWIRVGKVLPADDPVADEVGDAKLRERKPYRLRLPAGSTSRISAS